MERNARIILTLLLFLIGGEEFLVAGQGTSTNQSGGTNLWMVIGIVLVVFVVAVSIAICALNFAGKCASRPIDDGFNDLRDKMGIPRKYRQRNVFASPHAAEYNKDYFTTAGATNYNSDSYYASQQAWNYNRQVCSTIAASDCAASPSSYGRPTFFGPIETVDNCSLFTGGQYGAVVCIPSHHAHSAERTDCVEAVMPSAPDSVHITVDADVSPPSYESVVASDASVT